MSLRNAALAYADAGWFVLPVAPGTKNPGSVVGADWQHQSTRDDQQIRRWWRENAEYGIAVHVGRSGAVLFDLDTDSLGDLPAELRKPFEQAVFQRSRQGTTDRGHYLFSVEGDEQFGNGAGAFAPFGDVRGKNGAVIVAPTPHVDPQGEYRWIRAGELPPLPDVLRACLSQASQDEAPPLTDAEFDSFVTAPAHQNNDRPAALNGVLVQFEREVTDGGSSHEALVRALPWAFRDVIAGFYPAADAVGRLQEAFHESFGWEGRNPDGRSHPASNEFLRTAGWAAAQAKLADPAETLARANRDDPAEAVVDEDAFWSARRELTHLQEFARSRRVAPWSMLGVVLARAAAVIPPYVVLPPLVGDYASLNLFAALVAPSGGGKGTSEAAAEAFLETDPEVHTATPGSGEGILKEYAYKKRTEQVDLRNSVMFSVPEIDSLAALKGRSGATLMPELRKAWMGEPLGFSYAADDKKFAIKKHRFRMTMVVGVQPARSQTLFEDADGGTPQRFLWFPTIDPDRPPDRPDAPGPMKLSRWPGGVLVTESGLVTGAPDEDGLVSIELPQLRLSQRVDPDSFHVLSVPQTAVDAIDEHVAANLNGDDTDHMDSHGNLMRLKVAAVLMWLNGRTDSITEEDWELAGLVKAVSDRTRARAQKTLRAKADGASAMQGRAEGKRELAKATVLEADRVKRAVKLIRKHLQDAGRLTRRDGTKKLRPELRGYFDDAADRLVDAGVADRIDGKQGSYSLVFKGVD